MDAEVVKIATSAWQHDVAGLNFFIRPRICSITTYSIPSAP